MIYITGDTHNNYDIHKLSKSCFDDDKMTKEDFVIITGDFGFVWYGNRKDDWWLNWLNSKNYTVLFVDGNHENHQALNQYPIIEWNGGRIHRIRDTVYHLMRGQVFNISNHKIFTMGGAESRDKEQRQVNITWWSEEMPNYQEYKEALFNLEKNDWEVDYVITHAAPDHIQSQLCPWYKSNQLTKFLSDIDKQLTYKQWYFGHFHDNKVIDSKHTLIYDEIIEIGNPLIIHKKGV